MVAAKVGVEERSLKAVVKACACVPRFFRQADGPACLKIEGLRDWLAIVLESDERLVAKLARVMLPVLLL